MDTWERTLYELISVTITDAFAAVYAVHADPATPQTADSPVTLEAMPVDAIGVAKRTVRHFRRAASHGTCDSYKDVPDGTEVVGLDLFDGSWLICQEDGNFAGMIRRGDDPSQAIDCLDPAYFPRLVSPTYAEIRAGCQVRPFTVTPEDPQA